MRRALARWTVKHQHWEGDDYAGRIVVDGPDTEHSGYIDGYVVTHNTCVCAVILVPGESPIVMPVDEIAVDDTGDLS